jgi:hypothetical protein
MNKSESIQALAAALVKAQAKMPMVPFDSTNPFLHNKYASLGAVIQHSRPILAEFGLAVTQIPISEGDSIGIESILLHESGEFISDRLILPVGEEKGKSRAQVAGSIITYLRRYSWASVLGLYADEDTDGNAPPAPPARSAATNNMRGPGGSTKPQDAPGVRQAATSSPPARAATPPAQAPAAPPGKKLTAAERLAKEQAETATRMTKFMKMVNVACDGKVDVADEVFREMGILLPNESVAEYYPPGKLPATVQEANSICEEIATRAGVDFVPGAIPAAPSAPTAPPPRQPPVSPEPRKRRSEDNPLAEAAPDFSKALSVQGYVKKVTEKPTARGGTRFGILLVEDLQDCEGGWWVNTFDTVDGETALAFEKGGQWVICYYEESKYGMDLLKRGIQEGK